VPKKKLSPAQLTLARLRFYGALMSNLLDQIKTDPRVPAELREQARKRHEKWDEVSPYHPINPITIIELENQLK
jgi:hypothetical protein